MTFLRTPKMRRLARHLLASAGLAAASFAHAGANAQETISFPARASDLSGESYWSVTEFSEGCCVIDFNVKRWTGSGWSGGSGSENKDDYDWNVPLYAPANGVIASCWRNFPENLKQGASNRHPDFPSKIFGGGNHVMIITDEGNVISMAHFKQGSIPAELCPPNSGNTVYPNTVDKEAGWRVASYIEPANRPRIVEGQYLGRVGNSGQSTGPHLHMDSRPITGTDAFGREEMGAAVRMRFRDNWGHPYLNHSTNDDPAKWYRLRGGQFGGNAACESYQSNAPECGFKFVHASPYLRRADASAGAIKGGDTLFVSGNRAVTATIGANNNLKLIGWDLIGVSSINRKGEIEAGAVKEVKLSEPANGYVLAAVRQADDLLKLIAYRVTPTGGFQRVADKTAGKISTLDVATIGGTDKKTVTAVRTQNGGMKIIVWDIQVANNGTASVVRLGEASTGAVSQIALSRAKNFNGVYAAVRDSNANLKVVPFKISTNGQTVTRGKSGTAGAIQGYLSVAPLAQGVAAGVRDSNGKLTMITWSSGSNGDIGARRSTYRGGDVGEIKLLTSPHGGSNLTSVVRDSQGKMKLIGWKVNSNGTNLRRVGSSGTGAASKISADVHSRSYPGNDPRDMILTLVRDSGGDFKLISWDTNLVNP